VEDGAKFSSEETTLLVEGVPLAQLPAAMIRKLEQSDLAGLLDVLPRNLRVLLERAGYLLKKSGRTNPAPAE